MVILIRLLMEGEEAARVRQFLGLGLLQVAVAAVLLVE
jgi:hypothetical protein